MKLDENNGNCIRKYNRRLSKGQCSQVYGIQGNVILSGVDVSVENWFANSELVDMNYVNEMAEQHQSVS